MELREALAEFYQQKEEVETYLALVIKTHLDKFTKLTGYTPKEMRVTLLRTCHLGSPSKIASVHVGIDVDITE